MNNGVAIAFFEIEGFNGTFDGDAPRYACDEIASWLADEQLAES